jgi:hypothetical protein
MLIFLMLANGSDATFTNRNMKTGGSEHNPLTRPFVTHGSGLLFTTFAVGSGIELYGFHKIEQKHRKLSRVLMIGALAGEAYCISYSVKNR